MASKMNQIEKYIEEEKWEKARKEILKELRSHKDDHWLIIRLSTTYYEEKKYKKAFELAAKALKLAPNCPLVLWDYAGTLNMLGRNIEAIKTYQKIIKKGVEKIAYEECGEGLLWAKALYTDSFYRLALCYSEIGNLKKFKEYFEKHLSSRGKGIPSIYKLVYVKKKYNQILKAI